MIVVTGNGNVMVGMVEICSSTKKEYIPEITLKERNDWNEYCWGNKRVHVTIKNPEWKNIRIEHTHTVSSVADWKKSDFSRQEYSKRLEKQTSDQQYEFDLPQIPKNPLCNRNIKGLFQVYVTVDWREHVKTYNYENITIDDPFFACCLNNGTESSTSERWGTQCIPHSYWSIEARNSANPHLKVEPKKKRGELQWLESEKEQKWIRCD